jgi:hypothetical protein
VLPVALAIERRGEKTTSPPDLLKAAFGHVAAALGFERAMARGLMLAPRPYRGVRHQRERKR